MAVRTFHDSAGNLWEVYDVVMPIERGRAGKPLPAVGTGVSPLMDAWLCFESGADKRRLRPIPEDWDTATDDRLRRLLAAAIPVQPIG